GASDGAGTRSGSGAGIWTRSVSGEVRPMRTSAPGPTLRLTAISFFMAFVTSANGLDVRRTSCPGWRPWHRPATPGACRPPQTGADEARREARQNPSEVLSNRWTGWARAAQWPAHAGVEIH